MTGKNQVSKLPRFSAEVPPSEWQLEFVSKAPIPQAENWTAVYNAPPDVFGTNSLISHGITVFDTAEDAAEFLEAEYQIQLDLTKEIVASARLQHNDFNPPQRYSYSSPLADEFKIIYAPEIAVPTRSLVGYRYEVWARYGNVISYFMTIVENEEQTQIKAGEANVLPWREIERMLKTIDKRFEEAGKTSP